MKSFPITVLLAGGCFLPVFARGAGNSTYGDNFNATDIDEEIKTVWCTTQVAQCPILCADSGKETQKNECYPKTLDYDCTCGDGSRPNLTEYSETIPYYVCVQLQTDCINNCNAAASCAEDCRKQHTCGATHPKKYNATLANKTLDAPESSTSDKPSRGSDSFDGKPSSASSLLVGFGNTYGVGALALSISVGLALIAL